MTLADNTPSPAEDRLLPWKRVKDITGLSRTTAWRLQKAGDFPLPVVVSPGRVGWREHEIAAWKASRVPRGAQAPKPASPPRSFVAEPNRETRSPPPPAPYPPCTPAAPAASTGRARAAPKRPGRPGPPPKQMSFNF